MKAKIFFLLIIGLFTTSLLIAKPVSKENARIIAVSWYKHIAGTSITNYTIEDVHTVTHEDLTTLYVFNFRPNGFVIVAADDASIPILGYSAVNDFPEDISCPAAQNWIDDYSLQINHMIKSNTSNIETIEGWEAILKENFPKTTRDVGPLLTTTWWQGCYYNELCPADPAATSHCGHAVTGCVATAMAQLMKFHEFPPRGVGSYSYTHPVYGPQAVDFGNTTYDWASMPDNITSSNIPVATIMYHAGVAVNMKYSASGSAANLIDVQESFVDYFNYKPGIEWHNQSDYPDPEDWKTLLRSDLDNLLPVYYVGRNPSEGHAFICDGYRMSDDMFSFNWGWGGNHDGWYAIGALNPGGNSWNMNNVVLAHIEPGNPDLVTRITTPADNMVIGAGYPVELEAATVYGNADYMKIIVDGSVVASGPSNTLSYTWNTTENDLGSHDVMSWSYAGEDSVYYPVNLNIAHWITQASCFQTPMRQIGSIVAVDSNVVWAAAWDGIYSMFASCQDFTRTLDGGATWVPGVFPDCEGLTPSMIFPFSASKAYVSMYRYSGTKLPGIFLTLDGGITWNRQATASFSSPYSFPNCLYFFNENDGWCMGDPTPTAGGFECYTTNDGGLNWIPTPAGDIPTPSPGEYGMPGCSSVNDTIWFGTTKNRIYRSIDKGYTWTATEVPDMDDEWLIPVFRNSSHGLAHNLFNWPQTAQISETFDGGDTWTIVNTSGTVYRTGLAYVPGTDNTWVSSGGRRGIPEKGMSVSHDGGHTWETIPGTEGTNFGFMTWLNDRCGWAGGYNLNETEGGMYKFIGELVVTSIDQPQDNRIGTKVYPNPFSFNTTIEYELKEPGKMILSVYNHLGQQIETLVNQHQPQGKHKATWNAEKRSVGIYFYRLQAGKQSTTGKMVVLR